MLDSWESVETIKPSLCLSISIFIYDEDAKLNDIAKPMLQSDIRIKIFIFEIRYNFISIRYNADANTK